jgi:hypothetical protein
MKEGMNWKKAKVFVLTFITGFLMSVSLAFAVDYGSMTTEELSQLRGTMRNATFGERNAFRQEWQKRVQSMTREEREKYQVNRNGRYGNGRAREKYGDSDARGMHGSPGGGYGGGKGFGGGRGGRGGR